MAIRQNPELRAFIAGELSPRLLGRTDLIQYGLGMLQAVNGIVLPWGGFMRRSGTRYVTEVKNSAHNVRLLPFLYSTSSPYVVEFGNIYARFFANEGVIEASPGVPAEAVSPFLHTELADVQYTQSNDVMWLVHPDHYPYKLNRTAPTTFVFSKVAFSLGRAPLRPANLDELFKMTGSTATSTVGDTVTMTASGTGNTPFVSTAADAGRAIRVNTGSANYWVEIVTVTSTTVAVCKLMDGTSSTSPFDDWALGLFSNTEGSNAVTIHEGRVWYGGSRLYPDRLVGSVSDDYDNFELSDPAETDAQNADKSISKPVASGQNNAIKWLASGTNRLVVGTAGGEFAVTPASDDILTPLSTTVDPTTRRGSKHIQPLILDNQIIYVQRNGRKLREFIYDLQSDAYIAKWLTVLSEHVFRRQGVGALAYQQDPNSVIWCPRGDGTLIGLTFEKDQQIIAAHRHVLGGRFGSGSTRVESIATIPTPDETGDQLWCVVKRTIGGVTKQYIEFMEDDFVTDLDRRATIEEKRAALDLAFFVDSGLSLNAPKTVTGITNANPAVVTAASHGMTNGQTVKVRNVMGLYLPDLDADGFPVSGINQMSFTVANATTDTFELSGFDASELGAYIEGGAVYREVTSVTGLTHLVGQTVSLLVDGAAHPDVLVAVDGSVALNRKGSIVHAGLGFEYRGETTRLLGQTNFGTSQGRPQRFAGLYLRLHETLGGEVARGPKAPEWERMEYRDGSDLMDRPPPMFSGDYFVELPNDWHDEPTIAWRQTQPLPMTVLAIYPDLEVNA